MYGAPAAGRLYMTRLAQNLNLRILLHTCWSWGLIRTLVPKSD